MNEMEYKALASEKADRLEKMAGENLDEQGKADYAALESSINDDLESAERCRKAKERADSFKVSRGRQTETEKAEPIHEDIKRYSITKAILGQMSGRFSGLEREVSDELAKKSGKSAQGFFMPTHAQFANLDTTEGTGLKKTETRGESFIELLRAKNILSDLGTTYLTGLSGNVDLPRRSTSATSYWISGNASNSVVTKTASVADSVQLREKTVGAASLYFRSLLNQSSIDVDKYVMDDLAASVATAIEKAAFNGTGLNNQPTGILNDDNITVKNSGALGEAGAVSWAEALSLVSGVDATNGMGNKMYFVTTPEVKAALMATARIATYGSGFICEDNKVAGYDLFTSNNLPKDIVISSGTGCHPLIFGDFSHLIVGFWNEAIDVVVDPYTSKLAGGVEVSLLKSCDIAISQPAAFSMMLDINV